MDHAGKAAAAAAAIERRRRIAAAAAARPDLHAAIRAACAADAVGFIRDWCWCYEPRNASHGLPTDLPLDLWPVQAELVRWFEARERGGEPGIVEKSRGMGATWVAVTFMLHRWLFRDGWNGGIGSRKLQLVDHLGNPDCIFEKLRFALRHLPRWLRPRHDDARCRLRNTENGATIVGEGGDSIGRGGRSSFYLIDEAAFLENERRVAAALADNADVVVRVSTPNGADDLFCEDRESGRFPVFTMHWRRHPGRDEAWYAAKCRTLDAAMVAREYDINYHESVAPIFRDEWWGYYEPPAPRGRRIDSWDTAYKKTDAAAYNARVSAAATATAVYITDAWWEKLEYPELKIELMRSAADGVGGAAGELLIEDKSSGQSLLQEARRGTRLPIVAINPDADKVARAHAATPLVKDGRVLLPRGAAWVPGWLQAFGSFRAKDGRASGKCIDLVDAFSQLMEYLNLQVAPAAARRRDELTGQPVVDAADALPEMVA